MGASHYAANVIIGKARAMYGNSLTAHDFKELLGFHSVSEIAAYLKNRTAYATVLRDVNEATIHRGYLELLLRRKVYQDFAALSRYDATVGMNLSGYLLQRGENEMILQCLRLLSAGRAEEFFFSMPLFFASHTSLDVVKMSHVKSYAELVEVLAGTPYQAILERHPPDDQGRIPLTEIENALTTRLIDTLFAVIDRTSGKLKAALVNLCGSQVDALNVTRILRLKRYFHASEEQIRANLLPSGRCIPRRTMERMIAAADADEVMALFLTTAVGRQIPEAQRMFTHDLYHRAPYYNARHHIHFSPYPMVVLISYIIITEVEVDDIINIIEGIRYGLSPEEIRPMLVLFDHDRR